jgi:hypothetical protein
MIVSENRYTLFRIMLWRRSAPRYLDTLRRGLTQQRGESLMAFTPLLFGSLILTAGKKVPRERITSSRLLGYDYLVTWPRISPPGLASVCTLT